MPWTTHISCCGYIDDILLLWTGDYDELVDFMMTLNNNDRGIALTFEASTTSVHFLDLVINRKEGGFVFSTHFKSTDRNGYIPTDSCHHNSWIKSVPRSQFLRLRRNCTDCDTFMVQARMLKDRFVEKGYSSSDLDKEIENACKVDREALLQDRPKEPNDAFKWSFLTSFSTQHRHIKRIFQHHWDVLKTDKILGPLLPETPKVVFRGVPSLRNKLAPNVIDPPKKTSFFHNWTGFHPCKRCLVCQHNTCGRRTSHEFSSTVTGRTYAIKQFSTCATTGIVYLITCPCGKQYVGRTIRSFTVRVSEHINLIKAGSTKHTVPRHYRECHDRNPEGTQFLIIDRYVAPWRGGVNS